MSGPSLAEGEVSGPDLQLVELQELVYDLNRMVADGRVSLHCMWTALWRSTPRMSFAGIQIFDQETASYAPIAIPASSSRVLPTYVRCGKRKALDERRESR